MAVYTNTSYSRLFPAGRFIPDRSPSGICPPASQEKAENVFNSRRKMISTSRLLIQEPPLMVLPSLAKEIGLNEAIILQQLHYWLENPKVGVIRDSHKWVFNTYEEWKENFPFWSKATIQRAFSILETKGLIISKQFDRKKRDNTKFYRIDYDKLNGGDTMHHINLISSTISNCGDVLTETTTETTKPSDISLPENLNTPEFKEEWQEWIRFRKEIKKTLTPTTIKSQYKKLSQFCPRTAISMLEQSITNGWQGIFELKENTDWRKPESFTSHYSEYPETT